MIQFRQPNSLNTRLYFYYFQTLFPSQRLMHSLLRKKMHNDFWTEMGDFSHSEILAKSAPVLQNSLFSLDLVSLVDSRVR